MVINVCQIGYPEICSDLMLYLNFLREILGREDSWNILLCVSTCFSVVQLLTLPFFPEAPRYLLIEKGNTEACKKGSLCFLIVTEIEILDVQRDPS